MDNTSLVPHTDVNLVTSGWRHISREEKHVRLQSFVHQALIEEAVHRGMAIEKAVGMLHLYGMDILAQTIRGLYRILDDSAEDERVHQALAAWIKGDLPVLYEQMSYAVRASTDYIRGAASWSIEPPTRGFWGNLLNGG